MPNVLEAFFHVADIPAGFTIAKKYIAPFLVDILWNKGIMTNVRRVSHRLAEWFLGLTNVGGMISIGDFDRERVDSIMKPKAEGTR